MFCSSGTRDSCVEMPSTNSPVHKSSKVLTEFKLVSAKEDKEITLFARVDPERVEEWTQAAFPAEIDGNLAKRDAASKKQTAQRKTAIAEEHQKHARRPWSI